MLTFVLASKVHPACPRDRPTTQVMDGLDVEPERIARALFAGVKPPDTRKRRRKKKPFSPQARRK